VCATHASTRSLGCQRQGDHNTPSGLVGTPGWATTSVLSVLSAARYATVTRRAPPGLWQCRISPCTCVEVYVQCRPSTGGCLAVGFAHGHDGGWSTGRLSLQAEGGTQHISSSWLAATACHQGVCHLQGSVVYRYGVSSRAWHWVAGISCLLVDMWGWPSQQAGVVCPAVKRSTWPSLC
jgi:hypothetical protein